MTPARRGGAEAPVPTASWGRRIVALIVDWLASTLVVIAIVGFDRYAEVGAPEQNITLVVYLLESALFTWLVGGSFGKVLTGLRVVPADGRLRMLNPLRLLLRQLLVVLVIPPLVFKPDGRGLHDLAAGTATVTKPTFEAMLAGARSR